MSLDRRGFLQPGSLASAWHDPEPEAAWESSPPPLAPQLLSFTQKAMGTHFEWVFPMGSPLGTGIPQQAFHLVDQLEDCLTIYRETSEVSRLNRQAHDPEGCLVSPLLWELIDLSKNLAEATEGAFDPTFGALLQAWGFVKGPFRVPDPQEIDTLLAHSGMGQIELDPLRRRVKHRNPHLRWNFGAIGKGFALDCVVRWLQKRGGLGAFLLHSGRSSIYARGNNPAEEAGWVVQVNHPVSQTPLARIRLLDGALGTSAATYKHFEADGKLYGHILDPRMGRPAEKLLSASVFAPQSAVADALSTAVFVHGPELAETLARENPELGFLWLEKDDPTPKVLGRLTGMMVES